MLIVIFLVTFVTCEEYLSSSTPLRVNTKRGQHSDVKFNEKQTASSSLSKTDGEIWPALKQSLSSLRSANKMREALAFLDVPGNKNYMPILMNLGDPSIGGNMPPDDVIVNAIHRAANNRSFDGYGPSYGIEVAREAVVRHFSTARASFSADDVIMTSGATHALYMAIEAIADPGDNILVPKPGFPTYATLANGIGVKTREYQLIIESSGNVDLNHLESIISNRTKAIVINNPSNPAGTVFSANILQNIVKIAFRHKVVIISDEIYSDIVYNGAKFYSISEFRPMVPVIVCDAISKRYLVPGWRLGWMIIHNRYGALDDVKRGIVGLSQRILGPSVLLQGALPEMLDNTPHEAIEKIRRIVSTNTNTLYECLQKVPGLKPMLAYGSIFMVIQVDSKLYGNINDFIIGLISQKSVYVIPGHIFNLPGWFRVVLTYSHNVTHEACDRITAYCNMLRRAK